MKRVIFFLIFVFLFSTFSNSVSLSPPKDTLVLDHDFNGKIKFMVGQLANYDVIQFDFSAPFFKEKRKIVNVTGDTMFFTFDLNVPFDSISPGEHKYHIVIQPLGKNQGMAQAAVAYSLFIIKHFNIQYMTVGLDQKQYTKNDYSGIKFKVISLGNKTINNFDAILNIYDIDGNKLDTLKHEGFELNLYDEKPLIFDWDVNKRRPDIYKYDVSVFYGEDKNSFSKGDFKLGDVFVDVVNITNEFVTNIINEMDVEIDSRWNGDLTNVRANYILKKNGKTVSESNSPTIELKSWFKGNLKGFIDLKNVLNGKYNLTVDLKYVYKGVEKQTLKTFEVNVIDITESIAYKNANANGGYFYFGLIILILAIILFCYEFFGKKHKRHLTHSKKIISNNKNINNNIVYANSSNNHINTNINLRQKPSGVPILNKTNKFNNDKQFNINTAKSKMSWNDIKSNFESVNNVINNNNNKISSNSDDYDNYFNRHFKNAKKRDILDDFK